MITDIYSIVISIEFTDNHAEVFFASSSKVLGAVSSFLHSTCCSEQDPFCNFTLPWLWENCQHRWKGVLPFLIVRVVYSVCLKPVNWFMKFMWLEVSSNNFYVQFIFY